MGLGGFLGANARFLLATWISHQKWASAFPYATFTINISGSFILGFFTALFLRLHWLDQYRLFFAVGFLGAYTTFSTFEYESFQLGVLNGRWGAAALNLCGSLAAGFLAAYLGVAIASRFIAPRP